MKEDERKNSAKAQAHTWEMRNAQFLRVRGVATGQVRTKEGGCRTGKNKGGRTGQVRTKKGECSAGRRAGTGQVRTKDGECRAG